MIFTLEQIRALVPGLTVSDDALKLWLEGVETAIKGLTNNDFNRYRGDDGEIVWPADIKLGVLNMCSYDFEGGRDRANGGVASETISRHSVSYSAATGADSIGGYPASMMGFLRPYERARF